MGDYNKSKSKKGNFSPDEVEIIDPENYMGEKETVFSHQVLVMKCLRRVIEIRGHELTKGTNILQKDTAGNWKIVWKEDQREAYFGAIRIAIETMRCDFDEKADKNIGELEEEFDNVEKKYLKEQRKLWDDASESEKVILRKKYGVISDKMFNEKLPFFEKVMKEKIRICDKMFGELNLLSERNDFYEEAELTV